MRLPPLTDQELTPFLHEGVWVAKVATHNPDGTVRMTPLRFRPVTKVTWDFGKIPAA